MRRRTVAVLSAATLALAAGGAHGAPAATYTAPFALGPAGGDTYSRTVAQPDGRLLVGRAYVVPAVVSCGGGAPYANLRVQHVATGPVSEVVVDWQQAALEPYTFLSVGVHDGPTWFTSSKVRNVAPGTGTLKVPVSWPESETAFPRTVTIDVGLEASGACPSANGGTLLLTAVRVA